MASSFPNSFDNLPVNRVTGGPAPAADMNAADAAVNSTQARIGLTGSSDHSSHEYRIATLESQITPPVPTVTTSFGFEDGMTDGWVGTGTGAVANDGTVAHGGTHSLKVTCSSGTDGAQVAVTVASGTYTHRVFVRGDATSAGAFVTASIQDGTGSTQVSVPVALSATVWNEIWVTVPSSSGTIKLSVQGFSGITSGMRFWIDDSSYVSVTVPTMVAAAQTVLKNGIPIRWAGMGYYPTPATKDNTWDSIYHETKQQRYDLPDMAAAGINAVRIYAQSGITAAQYGPFLDECYRNGIDVWVGYFAAYLDYTVTANQTAQQAVFTGIVTALAYHPAVVGFLFGNEVNYNYVGGTNDSVWYPYLNTVLGAAKAIAPKQLMSTANGEIGVVAAQDSTMTNMDLWGANIYRNVTMSGVEETLNLGTTKPFIFTEYGNPRYDAVVSAEAQKSQGNMLLSLMKDIDAMDNVAGSFMFEWNDEWWKAGNSSSQTTGPNTTNNNNPIDGLYHEAYYGITLSVSLGNASARTKTQAYTLIKTYRKQIQNPTISEQISAIAQNATGTGSGELIKDSQGNRYKTVVNPRFLSSNGINAPLLITPYYVFNPESASTPILQMDGTSMVNASSKVSVWNDLSGTYNGQIGTHPTFIQGNSSNQPAFNSGVLNGLNTLGSAGTGQFMEMNNFPFGNNVTVFIVAANQRASLGSNQVDVLLSTRPSGQFFSGLSLATYNSFASMSSCFFTADTIGSGGTVTLYVNGASATGVALTKGTFYVLCATVTSLPAYSYMRLFQYTEFGTPFDGVNDIAEIRVYQGAMNGTQVSSITSTLRTKYSI